MFGSEVAGLVQLSLRWASGASMQSAFPERPPSKTRADAHLKVAGSRLANLSKTFTP